MKTTDLPITQRKGSFYLRKTFDGKQREVSLETKDSKIAKSRALRFLATEEANGFDVALEELKGKPVIKAGCNPTFAELETLYRDYCANSANPPRPCTIKLNLARLKLIMTKCGFKTIADIDQNKIAPVWFKGKKVITPTDKRTFASAIGSASGCFRVDALKFYATKKLTFQNPFKGMNLVKSKVQQYIPVSQETRETIWKDCQTELEPFDAMVVLLALGAGLRRSEICAAIPAWFSVQPDKVLIHVKEEAHFQPKEEEAGFVPITPELYKTLLDLRGESSSLYFVPSSTPNQNANRLNKRYDIINKWLKSKGMTGRKPLHNLRKEVGSLIASQGGILAASKVLRNTPAVAMVNYTGVANLATVDMGASFKQPENPLQVTADKLGITVAELLERIAKLG